MATRVVSPADIPTAWFHAASTPVSAPRAATKTSVTPMAEPMYLAVLFAPLPIAAWAAGTVAIAC